MVLAELIKQAYNTYLSEGCPLEQEKLKQEILTLLRIAEEKGNIQID